MAKDEFIIQYFDFLFQEHEEEIIHPELTKRLAQKWNNLSAEDKKVKCMN